MGSRMICNVCVSGVLIQNDKCLLVRHTYGKCRGKMLIPGGYVKENETPSKAIVREIYEETHIVTTVSALINMRFVNNEWCAFFLMDYISGSPESDGYENDFADFVSIKKLDEYPITNLSKYILYGVLANNPQIKKKKYLPREELMGKYELY